MNYKCYLEGKQAYYEGKNMWDCPYYHNTREAENWEDGYTEAWSEIAHSKVQ